MPMVVPVDWPPSPLGTPRLLIEMRVLVAVYGSGAAGVLRATELSCASESHLMQQSMSRGRRRAAVRLASLVIGCGPDEGVFAAVPAVDGGGSWNFCGGATVVPESHLVVTLLWAQAKSAEDSSMIINMFPRHQPSNCGFLRAIQSVTNRLNSKPPISTLLARGHFHDQSARRWSIRCAHRPALQHGRW